MSQVLIRHSRHNLFRLFAISTTALTAAVAQPALAQGAESGGLQDIVVTARRVEERLQDVPLSVTALSGEQVANNNVTQAIDLKGLVPNLVANKTATPGGVQFILRGQSSGSLPNISLDNRLAIYLDGIYIARTQGGSFTLADIERLEVLKGPQGTQFGKNVTAGSINFITAGPTGELGLILETTQGNFGRQRYRMTLNTPTFGGFSARFSYVHDEYAGDIRNATPGRTFGNITDAAPNTVTLVPPSLANPAGVTATYPASGFRYNIKPSNRRLGGYNNETFFAALRYDNDAGFTIDLKGDYAYNVEYTNGIQAMGFSNNFVGCSAAVLNLSQTFNCPAAFGGTTAGVNTLGGPLTSAAASTFLYGFTKRSVLAQDMSSKAPIRNRGLSLTVNYELSDNLTFRSITGYRKLNTSLQGDFDGGEIFLDNNAFNAQVSAATGGFVPIVLPPGGITRACVSCAFQFQRQNQISEELQLIGSIGDSIDFLAGAYYFREKGYSGNIFAANYNPVGGFFGFGLSPINATANNEVPAFAFSNGDLTNINSQSKALFGRVTFRPVEQLDIVLGGRYTWDKKRNIISPTLQSQLLDPSTGAPPALDRTLKDSRFTYDGTITYHITPDINVYGRYATAYLAGGFLRNVAFRPETTKSAEIGFKSELFNRRVRFNAAAFWQKSKDLQRATNAPPFGALVVNNLGFVKTKGFEAELTALPADGLTLNASLGFTKINSSDGSRNIQPKWSVNLGASYDVYTFADGAKVNFAIDGNWRSRYWGSAFPLYDPRGGYAVIDAAGTPSPLPAVVIAGYPNTLAYLRALDDAIGLGKYWLVNGRVSVSDIAMGSSVKGKVSGWVRNLLNRRDVSYATNYGAVIGGHFEQDRTYGIDFRLEF